MKKILKIRITTFKWTKQNKTDTMYKSRLL